MKNMIKTFIGRIKATLFKLNVEKRVYIGKGSKIIGGRQIFLKNNVSIRPFSFISCNKEATLIIGYNTDLGERTRIGCGKKIVIGNNVLFGPNVYVADQDHKYDFIDIPVMNQGVNIYDGVEIGDDSWIGINSVIVGNVKIGKHVVIGANSVVTKSIPDYSIAVGAPAKIIKRFNKITEKWESVK